MWAGRDQSVSRSLVHKPETLFRSTICPYIIGVDFKGYLLELADWRSNLADGEDVSRSKRVYFLRGMFRTEDIASRTFYRPDRGSSTFPLDGGPATLLRGQLNRGSDLVAKSLYDIPNPLPTLNDLLRKKTYSIRTLMAR